MVTLSEVEEQLKGIKVSFRFWGRPEMLELPHILIPGEQIQGCLNGRYDGGFAMLCATDQRLLLIDKKPLYLTLEDIRYDMVAEVDYGHRLLDATIRVCTPNKTLAFTSLRRMELRAMTTYLQRRVMEIRQQHAFQTTQFLQEQPLESPMPLPAFNPVGETNVGLEMATPGTTVPLPAATLPMPRFSNPYTNTSLLMRRRIGRFTR